MDPNVNAEKSEDEIEAKVTEVSNDGSKNELETPAQEALEPVIIVEDTENDGNTNF